MSQLDIFLSLSALQYGRYYLLFCIFSSHAPSLQYDCQVIPFDFEKICAPGPTGLPKIRRTILILYVCADAEVEATAQTSFHILQEKLLKHACIKVVQCRDSGICRVVSINMSRAQNLRLLS